MTTNVLLVVFRPTNFLHKVSVDAETTSEEILQIVCRTENFFYPKNCFLWFKNEQIDSKVKLQTIGLFPVPNFSKDFPEIRLKFLQQLFESKHIGKDVFLSTPENIDYNEILTISDENPNEFVEELRRTRRIEHFSWTSISLPTFSRKSIDFLPQISIELPELLHRDEWKAFVSFLTTDLSLRDGDLIVVGIRKETKTIKLKLTTNVVAQKKTLLKFNKKSMLNELKLTKKFFEIQYPQSKGKINLELTNFDVNFSNLEERTKISPIFIDLALKLSERTALIDQPIAEFLIDKTRRISTCLFNSFQRSSAEFVIDHMNYIYHNESPANSSTNEKILFYATPALRLDQFWQNFPFLSTNPIGEIGSYGQGFYLSRSPRQSIEKVQHIPHTTLYLLATVVQLGKTLEITDPTENFDEIPEDFQSVDVKFDEEFVVKSAEQIRPIYLIGLRRVDRFVIWRDAKIVDNDNADLYRQLRRKFDFNLYGCQSNIEVFEILSKKFIDPQMKCVVITNGADDGEEFLRQCRQIRSDLPAIVFCMNCKHHEQWAKRIPPPKIKVTNDVEQMIVFIEKTFSL